MLCFQRCIAHALTASSLSTALSPLPLYPSRPFSNSLSSSLLPPPFSFYEIEFCRLHRGEQSFSYLSFSRYHKDLQVQTDHSGQDYIVLIGWVDSHCVLPNCLHPIISLKMCFDSILSSCGQRSSNVGMQISFTQWLPFLQEEITGSYSRSTLIFCGNFILFPIVYELTPTVCQSSLTRQYHRHTLSLIVLTAALLTVGRHFLIMVWFAFT